jgi:hypothetical protein
MNYNYINHSHKYFYKESKELKKLRKRLYKILINIYDSPNNKNYEKIANINDKIIDFYKKVNNDTKGYETFNVVADDGDSIYTADNKELATREGGRVFISEDKIIDIVNKIIDSKLGLK